MLSAGTCTPRQQRNWDALQRQGVVILYNLEKRCDNLATGPANTGPVGPGRGLIAGRFLVYRIQSIFNTATAAQDFEFDASLLFLEEDPRIRRDDSPHNPPGRPFVVRAGATWATGGRVVMKLENDYPSRDALGYSREFGDPPVALIAGPSRAGPTAPACQIQQLPAPEL